MVSEYDIESYVVYSSFNHDSIGLVRQLKADADVAYRQVIITGAWMESGNMAVRQFIRHNGECQSIRQM